MKLLINSAFVTHSKFGAIYFINCSHGAYLLGSKYIDLPSRISTSNYHDSNFVAIKVRYFFVCPFLWRLRTMWNFFSHHPYLTTLPFRVLFCFKYDSTEQHIHVLSCLPITNTRWCQEMAHKLSFFIWLLLGLNYTATKKIL